MPAVPKTSERQIVGAARKLISRDGLDALSMQAVAAVVGVKAPSLYKHVADRKALVRAVVADVAAEMQRALEAAATTGAAASDLRAMAHAYRAYAQKLPRLYALLFASEGTDAQLPTKAYAPFVQVLLERTSALTGPRDALNGGRLLVAFSHGFVSMESAGAFHLSGDLDEAYSYGVDRAIGALTEQRTSARAPKPGRAPHRR